MQMLRVPLQSTDSRAGMRQAGIHHGGGGTGSGHPSITQPGTPRADGEPQRAVSTHHLHGDNVQITDQQSPTEESELDLRQLPGLSENQAYCNR